MKTGREIGDVWTEVKRQAASSKDLLSNTRLLKVRTRAYIGGRDMLMNLGEHGEIPVNDYALQQITGHLGIPKVYADRMRIDAPALLDYNINTWFAQAPQAEKRMVRLLDNNVRAFLSDRYRTLDNYDLLKFMLPELQKFGEGLDVDSCEVTDRRLYLKVTSPRLQRDVKVGDTVQMGIIIQNSEVGSGAISVLPFSNRLACLNGMVHNEWGKRRHHVGKKLGDDMDGIEEFLTDETRAADDMAFFMKIRDVTRACLSDVVIGKVVEQMQLADGIDIASPVSAIEVVAKRAGLSDELTDSIIDNFMVTGGNRKPTLYDLAQAITATAQYQSDYDTATELEILGGKVIALDKSEWREIADAKPGHTVSTRKSSSLAIATI